MADNQFKPGDRVRLGQYTGTVTESGPEVTYVDWDGARVRKEFNLNLTLLESLPLGGGISGQRPVVTSLRAINARFGYLRRR